jgi:hypothetical protein
MPAKTPAASSGGKGNDPPKKKPSKKKAVAKKKKVAKKSKKKGPKKFAPNTKNSTAKALQPTAGASSTMTNNQVTGKARNRDRRSQEVTLDNNTNSIFMSTQAEKKAKKARGSGGSGGGGATEGKGGGKKNNKLGRGKGGAAGPAGLDRDEMNFENAADRRARAVERMRRPKTGSKTATQFTQDVETLHSAPTQLPFPQDLAAEEGAEENAPAAVMDVTDDVKVVPRQKTLSELFYRGDKTKKRSDFFFVQLPTHFPRNEKAGRDSAEVARQRREDSAEQERQAELMREHGKKREEIDARTERTYLIPGKRSKITVGKPVEKGLEHVDPGRFGTLHRYKSGRMILQIGEVKFDLCKGVSSSFAQELHIADLTATREDEDGFHMPDTTQDFIKLDNVKDKFVTSMIL